MADSAKSTGFLEWAVRKAEGHFDGVSACADCESDLLTSYLKQFSTIR